VPRPCKCRWISVAPPAAAFKPIGVPGRTLEVIELTLDELEALRLADFEGLYQDAAADQMGVSRPTFGRLLERARHKVACALLHSRMLVFKGGPVMRANQRTFTCADCGADFQVPYGANRPGECPQCHSRNFHRAVAERGGGGPDAGRGRCVRRRRGWARVAQQAPKTAPGAEGTP